MTLLQALRLGLSRQVRRRGAEGDGEDGVALVVAVALVGLASILMLSMVSFSLRESRQTGRDRQRSSAVATAEGGVDRALAQMQSAVPANLPCSTTDVNTSAKPDTMTITTTVRYFSATGAELSCDVVRSGTSASVAAQALVTSVSQSSSLSGAAPVKRSVESLVQLKPMYANALTKAIYGNSGVAMANNATVYGTGAAPDADIYTNGDLVCANNQQYFGSVYAQGSISMRNTCSIEVNAHARRGYTSTSPNVVTKGDVLVSEGSADLTSGQVAGKVKAVSVTPSAFCTSNPGKCVTGAGAAPPPPVEPFPVLNWNSTVQAAWEAEGYQVVTVSTCTASDGPGKWLADNASRLERPTLLRTPCQFTVANNVNEISLKNNVAIFADGGVDLSNSMTIRSTDSTVRRLYLVQPYNAVSVHPCTAEGITLSNRVTIDKTVADLAYSPCNVRKANNTDFYGQIYAGGTAYFDNALTMYYRPLPVFGLNNEGRAVASYAVDVLYKREQIA